MRFITALKEEYQSYNAHGRPILKWAGVVGAVAFPVFYALHVVRGTKEYDSIWLRGLGFALYLVLALRDYWPQRLRPYYLGWSYVTFVYSLPFFFIFMSLKNGGGTIAVANTFMALFFLVLLTDWRNTLVMQVVGTVLAVAAYILTTDNPTMPRDYVGRWAPFILVLIGGSVVKFSQRQIQAERLDAVTALAGSIAHEMRHPLGQLKQSLKAMEDLLPVPILRSPAYSVAAPALEALYRQLAQSEQAVRRGLQVVSMTLDEVSAKPLDPASFSLLSAAEATESAVQEYGYDNDEDRARVRLEIAEDFTFRGQETAFLFVLFNLLKNALYYVPTHPGMAVTIRVERQCVRVRDTGPGIAPEIAGQLFLPFRSVGKSAGTGLGLAYCQRVMRAFGGGIECHSRLGEFTEFVLTFPPLPQQVIDEHRVRLLESTRAALAGKRVLVVEDNAAHRTATLHKLEPLNAVVDEAADGQRALDLLRLRRYDLVLMDLDLPGVDGYSLAERMRRGDAGPNHGSLILAHTSDAGPVAALKTQKVGMDGIVAKPSSQATLLTAMHQLLARPPRRGAQPLHGRRILLADDSAFNRKTVAAYIRNAGGDADEAEHGLRVMELLRGPTQYSALVLDLHMPGMDGMETVKAIRASGKPWANLPVVALTARSDNSAIEAARAAGFDAFLVKPVDAIGLYEALHNVLAGSAPVPLPAATASPARTPGDAPLLNIQRLESYRSLGLLEELLSDYLPEIRRLVANVEAGKAGYEPDVMRSLLHSLLGMGGEAGALALSQYVRSIYARVAEEGVWPADTEWISRIASLWADTEEALRRYADENKITAR